MWRVKVVVWGDGGITLGAYVGFSPSSFMCWTSIDVPEARDMVKALRKFAGQGSVDIKFISEKKWRC